MQIPIHRSSEGSTMPTYDYRCDTCGPFAAIRRVAERDTACACPACAAPAQRMLSLPALSLMPTAARAGHQLNERSAHAPQRSGEYTHRHGPGCGCGSKASGGPTTQGGLKTNPGGRPWMISH
ncbi:FmdB family zinc ribbon protein [Paraburkholderia sediminicola]|uniref:FmdB family zinc ribbon protein n=1 Tax=Paraburkholderia sediminicola TaxID=458836 RepID=UPI0038BDD52F